MAYSLIESELPSESPRSDARVASGSLTRSYDTLNRPITLAQFGALTTNSIQSPRTRIRVSGQYRNDMNERLVLDRHRPFVVIGNKIETNHRDMIQSGTTHFVFLIKIKCCIPPKDHAHPYIQRI
jgi:hypothetical protein